MIKAIHKLIDRDTILHLRIPFSFFLFPVFCFAVSQAASIDLFNTVVLFILLHFFIYPASNIYNSYMDKDTGSIGGLKHPPSVTVKLYYTSIIFDVIGLVLCAATGWINMLLVAVYVAFSKAYSWHGIRLKKYSFISWFTIAFFQGGYIFMVVSMVAEHNVHISWFGARHVVGMVVASLFVGGSYPLTQIYQHKEDRKRGDKTISSRLGIAGTFIFTIVMFTLSAVILCCYFYRYYTISQFFLFVVCLAPVVVYLLHWFIKSLGDNECADFEHTMFMNKISAVCMVICFVIIGVLNHVPVRGQ